MRGLAPLTWPSRVTGPLAAEDTGTRWIFGKPYHWWARPTRQLMLSRGALEDCDVCTPRGGLEQKVAEQLVGLADASGIPVDQLAKALNEPLRGGPLRLEVDPR